MTMGRWLPPFGISFTVDVAGRALRAGRQRCVPLVALFYLRATSTDSASATVSTRS